MHGVTHAHDAHAPRPGQASLLWSLSSSSLSRDILFKTRRVRNINIGLARNLKMPSREGRGREDIATRDMCRHSAAMNALSMQTADRAGGELGAVRFAIRAVFSHALFWSLHSLARSLAVWNGCRLTPSEREERPFQICNSENSISP